MHWFSKAHVQCLTEVCQIFANCTAKTLANICDQCLAMVSQKLLKAHYVNRVWQISQIFAKCTA